MAALYGRELAAAAACTAYGISSDDITTLRQPAGAGRAAVTTEREPPRIPGAPLTGSTTPTGQGGPEAQLQSAGSGGRPPPAGPACVMNSAWSGTWISTVVFAFSYQPDHQEKTRRERHRPQPRTAARAGGRGAPCQRRWQLDEGGAASVPAPVELGQCLHRNRLGAPGCPASPGGARAFVRGAVVDGHGAAHRVPRRPGRAIFSGTGVVGLRHRPGGAGAPGPDDRDLPATGACPGAAADLAADAAGEATGNPRAHSGALPAAGQMASLPRHAARPRGIGTGHGLPPMGGHGQ